MEIKTEIKEQVTKLIGLIGDAREAIASRATLIFEAQRGLSVEEWAKFCAYMHQAHRNYDPRTYKIPEPGVVMGEMVDAVARTEAYAAERKAGASAG